ncbi:MAG: hypothetical protein PHP11_05025 [Erysipelotrichaceae bacterium]|nr:hypothetical protein [Erysipelotrichaceae bacterium]MDD3924443.1 hypothetical protein [Erysipelotrichaceae bacterium]
MKNTGRGEIYLDNIEIFANGSREIDKNETQRLLPNEEKTFFIGAFINDLYKIDENQYSIKLETVIKCRDLYKEGIKDILIKKKLVYNTRFEVFHQIETISDSQNSYIK